MGHANIYIRKTNEAKWEAIGDKSAWVNDHLSREEEPTEIKDVEVVPTEDWDV